MSETSLAQLSTNFIQSKYLGRTRSECLLPESFSPYRRSLEDEHHYSEAPVLIQADLPYRKQTVVLRCFSFCNLTVGERGNGPIRSAMIVQVGR